MVFDAGVPCRPGGMRSEGCILGSVYFVPKTKRQESLFSNRFFCHASSVHVRLSRPSCFRGIAGGLFALGFRRSTPPRLSAFSTFVVRPLVAKFWARVHSISTMHGFP